MWGNSIVTPILILEIQPALFYNIHYTGELLSRLIYKYHWFYNLTGFNSDLHNHVWNLILHHITAQIRHSPQSVHPYFNRLTKRRVFIDMVKIDMWLSISFTAISYVQHLPLFINVEVLSRGAFISTLIQIVDSAC